VGAHAKNRENARAGNTTRVPPHEYPVKLSDRAGHHDTAGSAAVPGIAGSYRQIGS